MIQIAEARPAYVTFEVRAEEDREASIKAGHYVGRDIDFALITPMGSKDRIERVAAEWLEKIVQDSLDGRIPREWAAAYKDAYKAWKEGCEAPVNGVAVENWPGISPSQVKTLRSLHIRTIEDMAAANEEVIARIGMGGRALKQRAIDWLTSSKNTGTAAEELSALRVANEALRERNESLETQLRELSIRVEALVSAEAKAVPKKL